MGRSGGFEKMRIQMTQDIYSRVGTHYLLCTKYLLLTYYLLINPNLATYYAYLHTSIEILIR